MTIAYLPSIGNDAKVNLSAQGQWFGESIGGNIVEKNRTNDLMNRGNYYVDVPANMDSTSSWFFKEATDYNFINGIVQYRAIYIGADSRYNENEIIGNVSVSISHDGPSIADDSVDIDILYDGKYTVKTSVNSTLLDNEEDTTGVLSGRNDWAKSHTNNETLRPGEYHKYWIRLSFKQDPNLKGVVDYNYYITIKNLILTMRRTDGRLNFSRVFTLDLSEKDLTLKATLTSEFKIGDIFKVIEHSGLTHVFYYKDIENNPGDMSILVILRDSIMVNNKYVEIDLSKVAKNLILDKTFYSNFSECCGTTGTTGTTGTSGSPTLPTSSDPCVYKPMSNDFDEFVGNKYLLDILNSKKPQRNDYFIFFNTFSTETTDEFITRYGHKNYYWDSSVLHIDLNMINIQFFESIESGYDNRKKITITDQYEDFISKKFYTNSVIIQDDLITGIGFIPEDCRVKNNRSKLYYLWEGDIVNRKTTPQFFNIPQITTTEVISIPQMTESEIDIIFNKDVVDTVNFGFNRSTGILNTGQEYVRMGAPHQKRFDHGYSEVTYDLDREINEFSTTWAFSVNEKSIESQTEPTTSNPCSPPTTSSPESVCDISGNNLIINPNQFHVVLEKDYPTNGFDGTNNFSDRFTSIFKLHCNGNPDLEAISVDYNWCSQSWRVYVNNVNGDRVVFSIDDTTILSTTFENVITLNVYRYQDYGCFKKFIVQYSIHVNGTELINGTTYTKETTDSFVVTHNYGNDFSGSLSYWEVRNYLYKEAESYAKNMFKVFSNISWAELEKEIDNSQNQESTLKNFNFRRNIILRNIDWNFEDTLVFPIVLQGTGYQIDEKYNEEVRRSIFDFTKIDINNKSFAFTLEGTTNRLEWISDDFDVDRDILTIWVRLENWKGQRITMFYSDNRVIQDELYVNKKPYEPDFFAVWHMDKITRNSRKRFLEQKIYDGGESIIFTKDGDEMQSLIQIDRPYEYGVDQFYKSNYFRVVWNDMEFNKEDTEDINNFLKSALRGMKPNYMEIENIGSQFDYRLETDNNRENRGEIGGDDFIVFPAGDR